MPPSSTGSSPTLSSERRACGGKSSGTTRGIITLSLALPEIVSSTLTSSGISFDTVGVAGSDAGSGLATGRLGRSSDGGAGVAAGGSGSPKPGGRSDCGPRCASAGYSASRAHQAPNAKPIGLARKRIDGDRFFHALGRLGRVDPRQPDCTAYQRDHNQNPNRRSCHLYYSLAAKLYAPRTLCPIATTAV